MGGMNPPALDVVQFSNELVVTHQNSSFPFPNPFPNFDKMAPSGLGSMPKRSTNSENQSKSNVLSLKSTRTVIEGASVIRSLEKFKRSRPNMGFPVLLKK